MINLVDNELICKSRAGRFSRLVAELNIVFPKVTIEVVLSKYFFYVTVFYLKPQRMRRASDDG